MAFTRGGPCAMAPTGPPTAPALAGVLPPPCVTARPSRGPYTSGRPGLWLRSRPARIVPEGPSPRAGNDAQRLSHDRPERSRREPWGGAHDRSGDATHRAAPGVAAVPSRAADYAQMGDRRRRT